jgi:CBS domain-containing protein
VSCGTTDLQHHVRRFGTILFLRRYSSCRGGREDQRCGRRGFSDPQGKLDESGVPYYKALMEGEMKSQIKVQEVMHTGATWVGPDTPVTQLAKMMRDNDIGCLPIGENDRLIGMVTDRDIVCRGLADGAEVAKLTARDVMSGPIRFCRTNQDIGDALRIMEMGQVRRLPVINQEKRMVGILALGDICDKAGRDHMGEVMRAVSAHHL